MDRPVQALSWKAFALGLLGSLWLSEAKPQAYSITQPSINACVGAFLDSGGEGASGYNNNEDYTSTICADQPGQAISLNWTIFNLNTEGTEPYDQLTIYDGPDVNAPVIGTYAAGNSPGIVSASFANTSGCLTVHWTSNDVGEGLFAASITCYTPCEPPTAVVTMSEAAPALICQGEAVQFNATGSYAAAGYNVVEYAWHFPDGSPVDSTTGPVISHVFQDPGEYIVEIVLTDDNECNNTNLIDLPVRVSTTPVFDLGPDTTICLGGEVSLVGNVTPTTWTALPIVDFGEPIPLPDNLGQAFATPITYTIFQPGATLTDVDQLQEICVDMEHSFMGDLVIQIICPNGTSVTLHEQGGGGIFIGDANDLDDVDPDPGTCWHYCWSPTATNGTFADNASTNTMMASQGLSLIPGTYESVYPLSALQGCPLNGTWTFQITDNWSIDNGFICSWGMDFDPALYPDLTQFTPDLGLETADSSYWNGPGFVVDPNDHLSGVATPTSVGVFDYVFITTDNFGCQYSDTMSVTVNPSPSGPPVITGDADLCGGETSVLSTTLPFDTYLWSNNTSSPTTTVGGGSWTVTVGTGSCTFTSPPFVVIDHPAPQPQITGDLFNCGGVPVVLGVEPSYPQYLWSTNSVASMITVGSGNYSVTVTDQYGCTGSDAVTVVSAQTPTALFNVQPPSPQPPGVTAQFTSTSLGNGSTIVSWQWDFGNTIPGSGQENPAVTFDQPGLYPVTLVVTTAEGCTDTIASAYIVAPADVIVPNVFSPNGDGQNDALMFSNAQYFANNHLRVYNRWGQQIYESLNYQNTWTAQGLSEGTYYFVFAMTDGRKWAGPVTLLR